MAARDATDAGGAVLWSVAAFVVGAGFATASFGTMALDPSAVQWLLIGDRGQAFLGWHMARQAPAAFVPPLGTIPGYVAPHGASLALADGMPLFSLLLLPLSPLLPPVFQHAGIWLVLCHALLALLSFRLLLRLTADRATSFAGMLLVLVNPVLPFRRFHLSLCAQWMIVAALLLYVAPPRERAARDRSAALGLLVVACGTHPYLAVMVLGIVCAAAWARCASWRSVATSWTLYGVATIASLWLFGYLGSAELAAPGFGTFSADLLALIDPDGWSRVVPDIPSAAGEYEGFAFLGLGVLLVLAIDAMLWLQNVTRRARAPWPAPAWAGIRLAPLAVVLVAFAGFALSSHVRLAGVELLDLSAAYALLEPVPSSLRAAGRFVWPLYYVIVFAALVLLQRCIARRALRVGVILLAVAAQLADGWPRYATQGVALMALTNAHRPLRAAAWRGIGAEYREIRLIPPAVVDTDCDGGAYTRFHYIPFAFVAGLEGMRINSGHLSRHARDVVGQCAAQTRALLSGALEPDVVYVPSPAVLAESQLETASNASCGVLDGYHVCVATGHDTALLRALRHGAALDSRADPVQCAPGGAGADVSHHRRGVRHDPAAGVAALPLG